MATATRELIAALRTTAARLRSDGGYQWGHMGQCNCGHLAQTITSLGKGEIHALAMEREGDWRTQANEYCPTSGHRLDAIIREMLALGMNIHDIGNLEWLSDPAVLARLPGDRRHLRHNVRDDVVLYLETWAALLEAALPAPERERRPVAA